MFEEEQEDNKVNITLYEPHEFQKRMHYYCSDACPANFIIGIAGRGSGKSYWVLFQITADALTYNNCKLMLVSPTLSQAQHLFRQLLTELGMAGLIARKNQSVSSMYIELLNGSCIYVRAASSIDSLRGLRANRLYIDEASYIDQTIYQEVLLPITNFQTPGITNKVIMISTPKGKMNWLYSEWLKIGFDPSYRGCKWTCFDSPYRNDDMIEAARRNMSEAAFNQEYLAQWSDKNNLFTHVQDCATIPDIQQEPIPGERYIMAVDPALGGADYTSITIGNFKGQVIFIERFKRIINSQLKSKIASIALKWKPVKIIMEVTGLGKPIASDLKHEFQLYNIEEWTTSQNSKELIIEQLANAFDNKSIRIPAKPDFLVKELLDFTATPGRTRNTYKSASGHDDAVLSLAMYWHVYKRFAKSSGRYIIK